MSLGFGEIALILVIVLILFGAGKLPKVMSDLGKGVKSFKDGVNEAEMAEAKPAKKITKSKATKKKKA